MEWCKCEYLIINDNNLNPSSFAGGVVALQEVAVVKGNRAAPAVINRIPIKSLTLYYS